MKRGIEKKRKMIKKKEMKKVGNLENYKSRIFQNKSKSCQESKSKLHQESRKLNTKGRNQNSLVNNKLGNQINSSNNIIKKKGWGGVGLPALTGIILIFLLLPLISSYVPNAFNVNGKLTDSSGNALTGSYVLNFSIYDNETGGNLLWDSGNTTVTTDSNGAYSTRLTDINLNFSEQYYLEIMVETETTSPRINLSSSGYAFRAQNVSVSGVEFDSNIDINSKNLTTTGYGFFKYLGSLTSRITGLFVQDADFNGTVNITGDFAVNNSDFFVDVSNGRVGVGTATPGEKLEVVGSINVTSGNDICIGGGNCLSDMGSGNISGAGTSNTISKFTAGAIIGNSKITDDGEIVAVNNSNLFINMTSGNVGIGTTDPSGTTVDGVATTGKLVISGAGGSTGKTLVVQGTGSQGLIVDTTDATAGQSQASVDYHTPSGFALTGLAAVPGRILNSAVADEFIFNNRVGPIVFSADSSYTRKDLYIATTGNVGIGTTGPSEKLEVSNSTQGLTINPNAGVGGSPQINTTGTTNVTITSSGGSVIIKLG